MEGLRLCGLLLVLASACVPDDDDLTRGEPDDDDAAPYLAADIDLGDPVACASPGDGIFVDVTAAAGLEQVPFLAEYYSTEARFDSSAIGYSSSDVEAQGGLAVNDFDGDGHLDIAFVQIGTGPIAYRGDGALGFTPMPLPAPEDRYTAISAVDVEGDGDIDLYLGTPGANRLLRNTGTGFEDATDALNLSGGTGQTITASWADFDRDGDLDVFLGNYGPGSPAPTEQPVSDADVLLRQVDGAFEPVLGMLPDPDRIGFTYMGGWLDVNADGWLDLYVVSDLAGTAPNRLPNHLLINDGGVLRPDPDRGLDVTMFAMGLAVGDMDGDGDPDVHVSNAGPTFLGQNDGGVFVDISRTVDALSDRPDGDISWSTDFVDVDNDGALELFTAFGYMPTKGPDGGPQGTVNSPWQTDALWRWRPDDRSYDAIDAAVGLDDDAWTRTVVPADFDRDGVPEILIFSLDRGLSLKTAGCNDNAWLRITLRGRGGNRDAIGATVLTTVGGRRVSGQVTSGSTGTMSSRPPEVLLGLADAEVVYLDVIWPDGAVTRNLDVPTRRAVTLTQP
jgi:hypothetical protein